jgi:outer membrane protein assembly factor BamE (lipoprotein component of BamABCDE complex)
MRAILLMVAFALSVTVRAQEQNGYFARLLELHDLHNDGPKPKPQVLKYGAFIETGELCGVKLGISMSEAVAAWGKPKSISSTGNGNYWYLRYGDGCVLGFSDDRLVSIDLATGNLAGSRFDNGIRPDMTRGEITAVLGEPFFRDHAGIAYKVGGRRSVTFRFQIAGQFPKDEPEWVSAKLWNISIDGTEWVNNGMQADPATP